MWEEESTNKGNQIQKRARREIASMHRGLNCMLRIGSRNCTGLWVQIWISFLPPPAVQLASLIFCNSLSSLLCSYFVSFRLQSLFHSVCFPYPNWNEIFSGAVGAAVFLVGELSCSNSMSSANCILLKYSCSSFPNLNENSANCYLVSIVCNQNGKSV